MYILFENVSYNIYSHFLIVVNNISKYHYYYRNDYRDIFVTIHLTEI